MPDRISFLATIRANSNEDAPILVFADWLEEQGETGEAELLRVQCELRRTPEFLEESEANCEFNLFRENPRWAELNQRRMALQVSNPSLGLGLIPKGGRLSETFEDPVLGRVQWTIDGCWEFEAGPVEGVPVKGRFAPLNGEANADEWAGVRSCVNWARANARARDGQRQLLWDMLFFSGREMLLSYRFPNQELFVRLDSNGQFLGSSSFDNTSSA
jgi:uncharacterized protein (TIGR02996 family)